MPNPFAGQFPSSTPTAPANPFAGQFGAVKTAPVAPTIPAAPTPTNISNVGSSTPTATGGDPLTDALNAGVQSGAISAADAPKLMAQAQGTTSSIADAVAMTAFPDTVKTLADMQTNPQSIGASFKDVLDTPQGDVNAAATNFGKALKNFQGELSNDVPASKKIGDTLSTLVSGAGFLLSPITGFFDAASKIPELGTVAKLAFNLPFSFVGDASGDLGMGLINALPISPQAKTALEPGVRAIYALAGQIGVGGEVAPDVLGTLTDQFGAKDAATIEKQAQEMAAEKANVPQPTLSDIAEKPPSQDSVPNLETAPKEKTPIQNSPTVDLSGTPKTEGKPVQDVVAPKNEVPAKEPVPAKPVTDIIPPKTPVTVKGSDGSFKVSEDTGAPTTKVVDLRTGEEQEIPRESMKAVKPVADEITTKPSAVKSDSVVAETPEQENADGSKTSKIAKSIEAKAIEQGLTEKFKNLASYDPKTVADQADRISKLMGDDFSKARNIMRGNEPVPEGMSGTYLIKAMEDYARDTKDGKLMQEVASSPLTSETSVHAQELRMAGERDPDSAAAKIKEVNDANDAKAKTDADEVKKEAKKIEKAVKTPKPKVNWNDFISSLEC